MPGLASPTPGENCPANGEAPGPGENIPCAGDIPGVPCTNGEAPPSIKGVAGAKPPPGVCEPSRKPFCPADSLAKVSGSPVSMSIGASLSICSLR